MPFNNQLKDMIQNLMNKLSYLDRHFISHSEKKLLPWDIDTLQKAYLIVDLYPDYLYNYLRTMEQGGPYYIINFLNWKIKGYAQKGDTSLYIFFFIYLFYGCS